MNWFKSRSAEFEGQLLFDEPLSRHTYYRIGGPAEILAIPKSVADLELLARGIRESGMRFFVTGAGSNLLVADSGFPGLIIKIQKLNQEIVAENRDGTLLVRTGASVSVSTLLRRASQEGWGGLELLTGIPGLVGGVVAMNAGTHLGEAKDRLRAVEAFSLTEGTRREYPASELRFEYRKNLFLPEGSVVLSALWEVSPDDPAKVKASIDSTLLRRKSTQPLEYPSCGSVFKNPRESGKHAWQVVDELGLRGHRIGNAQFAEKHSNFILNLGGATAADVRALIELAKSRAASELGIRLQEEVIAVG